MAKQVIRPQLYFLEPGLGVDGENGRLLTGAEGAANRLPFPVTRGTVIAPAAPQPYAVFFYRPAIPPELIHTYSYQAESNWTTYAPEFSRTELRDDAWEATETGFIRIFVVPAPAEENLLSSLFRIEQGPVEESGVPAWMAGEIDALRRRWEKCRREGDVTLLLLADTHYAVGCTWPDTGESLRLAAETVSAEALVHLGDLTDGLLPGRYTRLVTESLLSQMREICSRVWCCLGNHDRNYFRGNPEKLSLSECAELYLGRDDPWYFEDLKEKKLRLFFLDSFDPEEKERYGFSRQEVRWLRKALRTTPRGWKGLLFSHVPPVAEIHVWSDTIRNGERVLSLLERFHRRRGAVLGWIHGHSHADQIYDKRAFPIIGIGCAKLEDFREHKPEGSLTWNREQNTRTQELWDLLLIHPAEGSMDFLRFGAGEDRHVERKP